MSKIDFYNPKMITTEVPENHREKKRERKGMDGLKLKNHFLSLVKQFKIIEMITLATFFKAIEILFK